MLLGLLVPAHADDCSGAKTQTDLNLCADHVFGRANVTLNATYKAVLDRLTDANAKTLLAAAQKEWLAFRDGECDFETSLSIGGTVHPMEALECKTVLTKARTQALHRLLTCSEGDVACPIPSR